MHRVSLIVALAIVPLAARAEPTAEERAAARVLFDEGRAAMAKGEYQRACPKLEESFRIDPGVGVQYNLADCQEHIGKLASAWANFSDAASKARAAKQDERADVARDRAAALAPRLTKIVIVATDATGTLVVKRDGTTVNKAAWGTAVPADPGEHVISASAPGKKPWQTMVSAKTEGASITVTIPALADAPAPPPAPVAAPAAGTPSDKGLGRQRIAAIAVGSAGVVGLAIGAGLGLLAKSKYDSSLAYCPDPEKPNVCTAPAKDLRDAALGAGTGSTVAFAIGGAALAGGIVLFLTAPSKRAGAPKAASIRPMLGTGQLGLDLTGRF